MSDKDTCPCPSCLPSNALHDGGDRDADRRGSVLEMNTQDHSNLQGGESEGLAYQELVV